MVHMRTLQALFIKQIKDTARNSAVLLLFFIFPVIALALIKGMGSMEIESTFFLSIFGIMHGVFTPISVTASMMAEEKEGNTLRFLLMSQVTPFEYLFSIGGFVFLCTMASGTIFLPLGNFTAVEMVKFMAVLSVGCILSVMLGMAIGAYAKNTTAATGISVPAGMVFAFLPMLAKFNDKIEKIAKFTFGQQISRYMEELGRPGMESVVIIGINFLLFLAVFIRVFKKNRLD